MKKTVLFDGECNLCNGIVQFIIKRDDNNQFQFASLQGNVGQSLVEKHELPGDLNTFILLKNDKVLTKSTAALYVFKDLKGLWKLLFAFIIIPKFLRDPVYNVIANNRYKWFGKQDHCMMPKPEYKEKFLD